MIYEFVVYKGVVCTASNRKVVSHDDMFELIYDKSDDPNEDIAEMLETGSCVISDDDDTYIVAIEPAKEA